MVARRTGARSTSVKQREAGGGIQARKARGNCHSSRNGCANQAPPGSGRMGRTVEHGGAALVSPWEWPAVQARRMSAARVIPVVAAVLTDAAGRVLLAQRPAHKHLGGKWEFPGGKIEPGEAPEAALARELREELGITIEITRALPRFTHDYGAVTIELVAFVCRLAPDSGPPHPHEHTALAWCAVDAVHTYDLAPADLPVLALLGAPAPAGPEAPCDRWGDTLPGAGPVPSM